MAKKPKLKAISLFSGAGGMDIGFKAAGFEICLAIEIDPSCCDTLRLNHPKRSVINESVSDVSSERIMREAGIKPLEAALVIGGPPCQSFSLAGHRKGLNDPRGQLLGEFVRVVRDVLPMAFVLENVKGLLNWNGGHAKEYLIEELQRPIEFDGKTYLYTVECGLLNAADFGVPQMRERAFFVGNRIGKSFKFPERTHSTNNGSMSPTLAPYATTWDAIGNLPPADEPSEVAKRVSKTIKQRIKKHGY